MSEKKDPHPKNSQVDFDDDEDIIELTDEVIVKPKEDDNYIDLKGTDATVPDAQSDIPIKTDVKEPQPDDEDDIFDLDGAAETDSLEDGAVIDLNEAFDDDENAIEEDEIIASAIEESLGTDDEDLAEDRIRLTDEAGTSAVKGDEDIISNTEDDEPDALSEQATVSAEKDGGIFETEEEIELEYESDEDEYDFFALDDKKPLETLETISMADEDPDDVGDDDIDFGPLANLDIDSGEDDEIIAMNAEPPVKPDLLAFDDEETLEFEEVGDLPDLTDEMGFEFDDGDDENGFGDSDDNVIDDSDDIIARAVEKSLVPEEVTAQIDLAMEPEFEFTEDSDAMAEENLAAITTEEIRKLAAVDDLPDIDDDINLEFEDEDDGVDIEDFGTLESEVETLSIEELEDSTAEEEEIIEITEFDEHFPEEDQKRLERAGVMDPSDSDEDDFLELIEVEEDDTVEDEDVIEFSNSEEQVDEDEIDSFFSEALEDGPEFVNNEMEPFGDTPVLSTDMAMATEPPADEDEEFDFSFDSSEISQQVDRLDTFLSDDPAAEPEVASLPAEPLAVKPLAEKETADENQAAVEDATESLSVTPDQIDAVLERVINDKFGGKIETIIYEVIQKAVTKEIDRMKGALLGGSGLGDDE